VGDKDCDGVRDTLDVPVTDGVAAGVPVSLGVTSELGV